MCDSQMVWDAHRKCAITHSVIPGHLIHTGFKHGLKVPVDTFLSGGREGEREREREREREGGGEREREGGEGGREGKREM